MKKIIAIILSLAMILALAAGCAEKPKPDEPAPQPQVEPVPEPEPTPEPEPEPEPVPEEYTLEREPGTNQLTFYWTKEGADYETSDMWIWYPGADGHGYLFHPCAYGGKVVINVPEDIEEVGFIVRTGCSDPGGASWGDATKDFGDDRFATIEGAYTDIYLKSGESAQYSSTDGGKTLQELKFFNMAGIVSTREIRYFITPSAKFTSLDDVKVTCEGREIAIESLSTLDNKVTTGVITVAEDLDISKAYEVELKGYGKSPAIPTEIFDSAEFIENYTYDGDDLGVWFENGEATFKLWAPTASNVVLNLFTAGDGVEAYANLPMQKAEKGVWQLAISDLPYGIYYTYSVTTSLGTQEAVDPYARSVGVNGNRGMVIDLAATDPEGFRTAQFDAPIKSYEDAIIWEVHVRDFSNIENGSQYPGKYLAFTETGLKNEAGVSIGVDYLKELGITHVHLQPVYDFATVDETRLDEPQFNWGYDPKNYNAPEGSYSTDPYHGEVRVFEFKRMVQALHEAGIGVVMDMVYNHTFSIDSCLNRVVPYYYYRYNGSGAPSNGSGCDNETASNRTMFRKYMVDSLGYWASEYQLDGFRFDLMALHDVQTMQEIEETVHKINPKALIYGEGWTGGTTTLNPNLQANQANIRKIVATGDGIGSVAVFNDAIRDGLKGSVFDQKSSGYISGAITKTNANKTIFGIAGGVTNGASWKVDNAMIINYMSAHDNNTLWDKLHFSNPDDSDEVLAEMNRFGAAIVLLSKGTPFWLAGEEMLRSKDGDENSYMSSDKVNNIDWELLVPGSMQYETMEFYRKMIEIRKTNAFLTDPKVTVNCELDDEIAIIVHWEKGGKEVASARLDPHTRTVEYISGFKGV